MRKYRSSACLWLLSFHNFTIEQLIAQLVTCLTACVCVCVCDDNVYGIVFGFVLVVSITGDAETDLELAKFWATDAEQETNTLPSTPDIARRMLKEVLVVGLDVGDLDKELSLEQRLDVFREQAGFVLELAGLTGDLMATESSTNGLAKSELKLRPEINSHTTALASADGTTDEAVKFGSSVLNLFSKRTE